MNAIDLHRQSIRILKFNSVIVGTEIWNTTRKFTIGSYSIMTQMVIYFWCNFWTVYKYRHDTIYVMEVLNCAGIAFQLSVKFFIAMSNKQTMFDMCLAMERELYEKYPNRTTREGEIVFEFAKKYNIVLKLLTFLYGSTLFVFALYPLFIYVSEGRLIPLFMFEVSYVDWHSTGGYLLTNFVQVLTYVMGISGMILADGVFILLVVHGLVYMEVYMIHMDELGLLLHTENTVEDESITGDLWIQCLKEHKKIATYLSDVENFSGKICLILVFTGVFAICDNLILCALTDWYASYLFLLVCFVQMTIYFAIGNAIELKGEALYLSIVNFPWNLLNINQQKQYLFLLCRMQNPFILTVYGFSKLNFESYMAILKALYQFAMMILNFLT